MNSTNAGSEARVVVIDDEPMNRELLRDMLSLQGYDVLTAADGLSGLAICEAQPPDIILLDLMMPRMDGREVLRRLKADEQLQHIPVIIISGVDDVRTIASCIEMGAEDHLLKPFNRILLNARIQAGLAKHRLYTQEKAFREQLQDYNQSLEHRVKEQVRRLSEAQWAIIYALSNLAESRDPETGEHIDRMSAYCRIIAEWVACNSSCADSAFVQTMTEAAPLHDIGKVGIPDHILRKPGKLTTEEFDTMKEHTTIGERTLQTVNQRFPGNAFIVMGIEISGSHHEKWDGTGYPRGLSGEQIPLSARILALGDVYDALTSRRCYKEAFSPEKSREIIIEGRGKHFDPMVVDAFLAEESAFEDTRKNIQDSEG